MSRLARRDLLTVALAVAAGTHGALIVEHWRERPILGLGFLTATVCLAAAGAWLQLARSPRGPAAFCLPLLATLLVLFLLTRTSGLPIVGKEEWDPVGIVTQLFELTGLGLALSLLQPAFRPSLPNRKGVHHAQHA